MRYPRDASFGQNQGGGVDCLTLLAEVYAEAGVVRYGVPINSRATRTTAARRKFFVVCSTGNIHLDERVSAPGEGNDDTDEARSD